MTRTKPTEALLLVTPAQCSRCNYVWTECSILYRIGGNSYSYDTSEEYYQGVVDGTIPVQGRREMPSRKSPVCFNCITHPKIVVWNQSAAHFPLEYDEPEPRKTRPKKSQLSTEEQQAALKKLMEM